MAIVPQEVPVEKPIKAAKRKVRAGTKVGDSDHSNSRCETNSAVFMSLVTKAIDQAMVRIKTALNITLKPYTISSITLAKAKEPRRMVTTMAVINDSSEAHKSAI